MGNTRRGRAVASATRSSATDLYQVLETSDVPAGVVNIVTGRRDVLAPVLAAHDDVDAVWYFGSAARRGRGREALHRQHEAHLDRAQGAASSIPSTGEGHEFLREATQVKNIWTPSGE